jgi:hypothetical protein
MQWRAGILQLFLHPQTLTPPCPPHPSGKTPVPDSLTRTNWAAKGEEKYSMRPCATRAERTASSACRGRSSTHTHHSLRAARLNLKRLSHTGLCHA